MAEGGQPPIVYHFENVGTVKVVAEQYVTNINQSQIESMVITPSSGERRDEAFFVDYESGHTEWDNAPGSKQQDKESESSKTDITWLQSGKFGVHIKKPLYSGAKVYRGEQRLTSKSSRDVAIKLIEFHKKNRKEVDLLLKLQHPNIVQIIDAGDHLGAVHWIYIVMELCSQNLQQYINENKLKPINFKKQFSFSKQLATGLVYLHQNKIVHRDLKPENVLVSMCKNFVKLSDFGLSKEIQKRRSVATVTTIGVGSDGFRSPETYRPTIRITSRLDIFPLGLILHLLFTNGLHPFGSDPYDWSYNIRRNKDLDLSQIPEFAEPNTLKKRQLVELLNRMLRQAPRDRPTADEVKNDPFFTDMPLEKGRTLDDQAAGIGILSTSVRPTSLEAPKENKGLQDGDAKNPSNVQKMIKEFENPFPKEEKTVNANVPENDIPAASASSQPCEDLKDAKHQQDGKSEKVSNVQRIIKQLKNLTQGANEVGEKEAALGISSSSTISLTSEASTHSELWHEMSKKNTVDANEASSVSHNVQTTNIPPKTKNEEHLKVASKSKPKDPKTKPKKGLKLMERMRYRKDVDVLHQLYHYEESDKLKVSLKIAGYELYLQRGREQDSMRRVEDIITTSKPHSAAELLELATTSHQKGKYVRSLILLHVSHNVHKSQQASPDEEVIWIEGLEWKISDSTELLIEAGGVSRDIAIRYGLEFMETLLTELQSVKNATPKVRALNEAGCLVNISYICIIAGEYGRSTTFCKYGVDTLEEQFGTDASYYGQYGMLLNNMALAHQKTCDYVNAEKYFFGAMEGYKKAKNLPEDKRRALMGNMIKNVKRVRRRSEEILS